MQIGATNPHDRKRGTACSTLTVGAVTNIKRERLVPQLKIDLSAEATADVRCGHTWLLDVVSR
ncbi:hypothetical protein BCAR13_1840038 [Paraburkholderia caribensis]|nr:hypothetical protein BCAR13_1840038 [Paraburkholderia caribensis]